jgi:hypothetical protein
MVRLALRGRRDDRVLTELAWFPDGSRLGFLNLTTTFRELNEESLASFRARLGQKMPRTRQSPERKAAIGTHFPVVADIATKSLVARHAASSRPCSRNDFELERFVERNVGFAALRSQVALDRNRGSRSSTSGPGRSTRSAGLDSNSTRTPTVETTLCNITLSGSHCCNWEDELGMVGIGCFVLGFENTSSHTIPSRMTPR